MSELTSAGRRVRTDARWWHGATAAAAAASLVVQLIVVLVDGQSVVRYLSFFTIQSNVLVCVTSTMLAREPDRDGRVFRVVRLTAVICITVTRNRPLVPVAAASRDPEPDRLGCCL